MKKLFFAALVWLLAISTYGQSVDGALKTLTASGTDTYAVTEPLPATYSPKERFLVRFTNANTGAATLNRSTLGAKSIVKADGSALVAGDIEAGGTYLLSYNGTNFQMVGDGGGGGGSMVYPGAGIPLSTGSAWGTSITDNSANWNTAFGWGNHASAGYLTSLTNGNGTTANGTAVDLGGDLTGDVTINGASTYSVNLGGLFSASPLVNFNVYSASDVYFSGDGGSSDFAISAAGAQLTSTFANALRYNGTELNLLLGITDGVSAEGFQIDNNGTIKLRIPKTGSNWQLNLGTDATGDTYYRNSSGYFTRLPVGTNGHVLTLASGIPSWAAPAAGYTDEQAQDAIGAMVDASLNYVDGTPLLQRAALTGAVTATAGSNATSLGSFTTSQLNTAVSDNDVATLAGSESLTNKTLGAGTFWSSAPSITDGLTITFNPNGTQAGFNFGSHASNPSVGNPGDGFYNSTNNEIMFNDGNWRVAVLKDQNQTLTNKTIDPTANTIRYPVRTESASGTYTLVAADENKTIEFSTASPITVTLPNGLSTSFGCTLVNAGGGTITLSATGTLQSTATTIPTQYTGAYVQHKGSNVWIAQGALGTPSGGSGDVVGPGSATDNAVARFDLTTGKLIQNSAVSIQDDGDIDVGTDAGVTRTISATGSGSNIGLYLSPKGSSVVSLQNAGTVVSVDFNSSLYLDPDNSAGPRIYPFYNSTKTQAGPFLVQGANGTVGGTVHGQDIRIRGGDAYTSGNNNGGDIYLYGGDHNGSGDVGSIYIADTDEKISYFGATPVVKQSAVTTNQGIADALTAYGLLPSSTISSGGTYFAPATVAADATDADFTIAVNSIKYLPAATLSTNRTITIPAGTNGDVIEIYNNEAGYVWNLAGGAVYLSDGVTTITSLMANTNYEIRKVSGKWRIKN